MSARRSAKKKTDVVVAEKAKTPVDEGEKSKTKKKRVSIAARKEALQWQKAIYTIKNKLDNDIGIRGEALDVLLGLAEHALEKVVVAVNALHIAGRKGKLEARSIEAACRIVFPTEISKFAISHGSAAALRFHNNKKSSDGKKHSSKEKAGVSFSPSRLLKYLKRNLCKAISQISPRSLAYLAGVMDYLMAEVMDLSIAAARDNKKKRISARSIVLAVKYDAELNKVFNGYMFNGGEIPHIEPAFLPKRRKRSVKKTAESSAEEAPKKSKKKKLQFVDEEEEVASEPELAAATAQSMEVDNE